MFDQNTKKLMRHVGLIKAFHLINCELEKITPMMNIKKELFSLLIQINQETASWMNQGSNISSYSQIPTYSVYKTER